MTYESFKENLIAALQVHFPVGTSVFIQQFQRNNHILLDGLSILEPGSNISPRSEERRVGKECYS